MAKNPDCRILLVPAGGIIAKNRLSPADTLLRCQKAITLWQTGQYDLILVCGGIFTPFPDTHTVPAADLMKSYLLENIPGISKEKILTEDSSRDTFENVKFALATLETARIKTSDITVVTQWQHAIRFWITFRFCRNIKVKLKPMFYRTALRIKLNECLFIAYHIYDPCGNKNLARKNRQNRTF